MKPFAKSALLAMVWLTANILHAQLPLSSSDLAAIEATSPTPANQLPSVGTFYSAASPSAPPLPANISGCSGWDLGNLSGTEIYLLDDLAGSSGAMDASSGGGFQAMDDSDPVPPGTNSGAAFAFTNTYSGFPSNGLYLQVNNISNDFMCASLNGATDYVYEIFSITNLAIATTLSNWNIETEVFPGVNTNVMPFTVPMNGRNPLFLWARDWTGITTGSNQTPSWWFWYYFGATELSDTNLDGSGNTLLYDYTNNIDPTGPPALSIIWPQNGTPISGSNFTLQAQAGGPAVTVRAMIVDTNGDTNTVQGLVEQSGAVWVQNLPLAAGSNTLTVTATDQLGNQVTTNLTVAQSTVTVTMDSLTGDQLNQQSVNVSGTVSDPTSDVCVNGVEATNDDGTWAATNVPVSPTDMAVFNLKVYTGDPVLETSQNYIQAQPPMVVLSSYSALAYLSVSNEDDEGPANCLESDDWSWSGGGALYCIGAFPNLSFLELTDDIPQDGPGFAAPWWYYNETNFEPVWEQSAITYDDVTNNYEQRTNQTQVMLVPSGGQAVGTMGTYLVLAHASEFSVPPLLDPSPPYLFYWGYLFSLSPPSWYAGDVPLPPEWLQINGQQLANTGITNADGSVLGAIVVQAQAGVPTNVTVTATQVHVNNDYTFGETAYQLVSQCVATTPANQARTNLGVGEQVNLFFNPSLPANFTNITWSATGGSLAVTAGITNLFTAPDNATNVTLTVTIGRIPMNLYFQVFAPTGYANAQIVSTNHFPIGEAAVEMHLNVVMGPTNVSFYQVQIEEVGEYGTNISGYFTNFPPIFHSTANQFVLLEMNNAFPYGDECQIGPLPNPPPPWSAGGFTWPIPVNWQVGTNGATNSIPGWAQIFSMDNNATMTIQKFGHSVTRTTNDVITTN